MIKHNEAYEAAITGDTRRILLKAVIDLISPDLRYSTVQSSGLTAFSQKEQIHNKVFTLNSKYVTLEQNRWSLAGDFALVPQNNVIVGEISTVSDVLCDENGVFENEPWVEETFTGVSILQAFSLYFPTDNYDGIPVDFKVEVKQGGTAYYTKEIVGNTETQLAFSGFTVYNPDAIRVTVSKWSLPYRRMRTVEILPGIYEEWNSDIIASFSVKQQGDVSMVTLPYGTCTLKMDNLDRRFEPRNKEGIFRSIEERQGLPLEIGVRLADGTDDFKRIGVYYQYASGWKTSDNNLTMTWELVDIIGLLAGREYIVPATLPTTLDGWAKSVVLQLGNNFADKYIVDSNFANVAVTVQNADALTGLTCGDIIRYVAMASGTWARADATTGFLAFEPTWKQGNKLTLDNLVNYPTMKANTDLAAIIFTLSDGSQYVVSGNATASSETVSINNPFIHNASQALTCAKAILSTYGGNRLETVGRGNPSSEIGDVDTVELDESNATTGRRIYQTFSFDGGVLRNAQSTLLQADGVFLYEGREIITQDGTWTAPTGATKLRVIVVNGGAGGQDGTDGTWERNGVKGADGLGGKVYTETIDINANQAFAVTIGKGGDIGRAGGVTTFGALSGANGEVYSPSFTDIENGDAFARTGVVKPLNGTGDGGRGGNGGEKGKQRQVTQQIAIPSLGGVVVKPITMTVIDNYPQSGGKGTKGADGCVVVYWNKG